MEKKIRQVADKYFKQSEELHKLCEEYITEKVKEQGTISFEDIEDSVYVTYDGGRHPEYASGYEKVYALIEEDGEVVAELEDGTESIDCFSTDDIYEIYMALYSMLP